MAVDITDDLINNLELLRAWPGCDYQFSAKAFDPFNNWVRMAHPESDPQAMYQDRLSPEGHALGRYTRGVVVAHGGQPTRGSPT